MAAILNFPRSPKDEATTGTAPTEGAGTRRTACPGTRPLDGVPAPMVDAIEAVRGMRRHPRVTYREIPVPADLAAYGIGVDMAVRDGAAGWLMLLYHPAGPSGTDRWRCAAYLRTTPMPPADAGEGDVPRMWRRMWDAHATGALVAPGSAAGTITICGNTPLDPSGAPWADRELRLSWTPATHAAPGGGPGRWVDAGRQVGLWEGLLLDATDATA